MLKTIPSSTTINIPHSLLTLHLPSPSPRPCCAPCAGITPPASTTVSAPVRAARASSSGRSRRTPSMFVLRTRTAPWTSAEGTVASSAASRSAW